jgi:sigma-E factor negative regulatory protein RseC
VLESPLATVIAVNGGQATLLLENPSACRRCAEGRGCGAGLLAGGERHREIELAVPAGLALVAGDRVSLALDGTSILRGALLAYGAPLAGLLAAVAITSLANSAVSDPVAAMIATLGLVAGWAVGKWRLGRQRCLRRFQPTIAGRDDAGL